jgi:hypothetical protein
MTLLIKSLLKGYIKRLSKTHSIPQPLQARVLDILEATAYYRGKPLLELSHEDHQELEKLFDENEFEVRTDDIFKKYVNIGNKYSVKLGKEGLRGHTNDLFHKSKITFYPSLDEALNFIPFEQAIKLFETEHHPKLAARSSVVRSLNPRMFPVGYYTHNDLVRIFRKFKQYLLENKKPLIETGYPDTYFDDDLLLANSFTNVLPIHKPHHIRHNLDNHKLSHYWGVDKSDPSASEKIYTDESLKPLGALEAIRESLFEARLKCIDFFIAHLLNEGSPSLWETCSLFITDSLGKDLINTLNEFNGRMIPFKLVERQLFRRGRDFLGYVRCLIDLGSLRSLVEWVSYIEWECQRKQLHELRTLIESHSTGEYLKSYYQLITHSNIKGINRGLDDLLLGEDDGILPMKITSRVLELGSDVSKSAGVLDRCTADLFTLVSKLGGESYFDFSLWNEMIPIPIPQVRIIDGILYLNEKPKYLSLSVGEDSPRKLMIKKISEDGFITREEFKLISDSTDTLSGIDQVKRKINLDVKNKTDFQEDLILNEHSRFIFNPIFFL